TKREIAVLHVDVGVADAAAADPHEDFSTLRRGALRRCFAQRRTVGCQRLSDQLGHCVTLAESERASRTKPSISTSSARAVSAMPASSSRICGLHPKDLRLWRSIFRR